MLVKVRFEDPGFDQAAAIGEGNAIKIVLDDRFSFSRSLLARALGGNRDFGRRGCWRCRLSRWLGRRRSLGRRRGRLRHVLLQQRLKQNNDQEGEREHQQQPALHAGILLRIVEVRQIRYSVTARLAGGAALCVTL